MCEFFLPYSDFGAVPIDLSPRLGLFVHVHLSLLTSIAEVVVARAQVVIFADSRHLFWAQIEVRSRIVQLGQFATKLD